jgi:hypothetical protein
MRVGCFLKPDPSAEVESFALRRSTPKRDSDSGQGCDCGLAGIKVPGAATNLTRRALRNAKQIGEEGSPGCGIEHTFNFSSPSHAPAREESHRDRRAYLEDFLPCLYQYY